MFHTFQNITSNLPRILDKGIAKKLLLDKNVKSLFKMATETSCFQGTEDRFRGITVDSQQEHCSFQEFPHKLDESLRFWITNSKRGIWFKVAIEHSDWVPVLTKNGFNFHHANPGYVMMYRWLPEHESCNIPDYAHTMLAVGAVVTNKNSQVLIVKEKYFLTPHWKFPGGIVDPGENLIAAAIREVKEETNIDAEFETLLCFRHAHKGMFDCSDMYVVFGLKALNQDVRHCPREIMAAKWIDIQEFLKSDEVSDLNKLFMQRYLEYKDKNIKIECKDGYHEMLKKHYSVYSAVDSQQTTGKL